MKPMRELAKEFGAFLWRERWWWLTPILLAGVALAALVFLAAQPSAAPFVYTLF